MRVRRRPEGEFRRAVYRVARYTACLVNTVYCAPSDTCARLTFAARHRCRLASHKALARMPMTGTICAPTTKRQVEAKQDTFSAAADALFGPRERMQAERR